MEPARPIDLADETTYAPDDIPEAAVEEFLRVLRSLRRCDIEVVGARFLANCEYVYGRVIKACAKHNVELAESKLGEPS